MMKIFFPAGLELTTTPGLVENKQKYDLLSDKSHLILQDRTSILLISRIFSLLSIESNSVDKNGV
jgi:hypothetical protein